MIITQATLQDMDGVFAILRANHVSNVPEEEKKNGFVTTNLTEEQMKALIEKENGVTIAKDDDGRVVAFALAASWEFWSEWPLFAY
ncbi:MAG: GNAT family acetyltransferase, partial [Lachnospiraceae bacterium]|nr:GNAT family acetyltransferase [Lachnospiraceae bacterium]